MLRQHTTKLSLRVVAMVTFTPNSYGGRALPLLMHSTSNPIRPRPSCQPLFAQIDPNRAPLASVNLPDFPGEISRSQRRAEKRVEGHSVALELRTQANRG